MYVVNKGLLAGGRGESDVHCEQGDIEGAGWLQWKGSVGRVRARQCVWRNKVSYVL